MRKFWKRLMCLLRGGRSRDEERQRVDNRLNRVNRILTEVERARLARLDAEYYARRKHL